MGKVNILTDSVKNNLEEYFESLILNRFQDCDDLRSSLERDLGVNFKLEDYNLKSVDYAFNTNLSINGKEFCFISIKYIFDNSEFITITEVDLTFN